MCGIIGVFGRKDAEKLVSKGIGLMKSRGRDGSGVKTLLGGKGAIGHVLHSIVGNVAQPIVTKQGSMIAANCEIYNWKEIAKQLRHGARNDAETILQLLDSRLDEKNPADSKAKDSLVAALDELDGDYAFCYLGQGQRHLVLARDLIGVKPLFYSHADGFAFASEKKVLESLGYQDIVELNPRKVLVYDISYDRLEMVQRDFYTSMVRKRSVADTKKELSRLLIGSVEKRIPKKKLGILFSGGVDSTLLALICKKLGVEFTCYTVALSEPGLKEAEDLIYAKRIAEDYGFALRIKKISLAQAERYLKKVVPLIEDTNVTKVGVGLTFYPACELAKKDGVKVILSGLGSEEIFAGYQRHKNSSNINQECISGLLKIYERDLYRDDVITMANSLELRVPFLDRELIRYALSIPSEYKIKKQDAQDIEKYILRLVAEDMGLEEEFAFRKKKAAQYGSRVLNAIEKLSHRAGFALKAEYLRQFYPKHNLRLAALVSGGKDSLYAAYVMQRQNYEIACLVSLRSKNPASYMFHTPAIDMVKIQAETMKKPLIMQDTEGEKEKELADLRKALLCAKKRYGIDGVVTGALYSSYQRDRVEKVCDGLGLKVFSPLWHINQETYMTELLDNGFKFIFTSIAADGLSKEWLGREITEKDIKMLSALNKKIGLNVAGEGGEYESLVFDCPMFERPLVIKNGKAVMEDENTGAYLILKAELSKAEER